MSPADSRAVPPLLDRLGSSVRRRVLTAACIVLAAGVAVFAVSVVPGVRVHPGFDGPWDEWLESGLFILAAAVVGLRAGLLRQDRLAWTVLALGMASFCAGNLYYNVALRSLAHVPIPSLQDALDLAFYPCVYVFVVLQLRRQLSRLPLSVWLNGAVPVLGVAALFAAGLFARVLADTSGSAAAVVTNLAYPIGDVVLLIVIVGAFGLFAWRPPLMWWLVGLGMGALVGADQAYLFQASSNTYQPGTWVDLLWVVGMASLAVAAARAVPGVTRSVEIAGRAALVVPSLFTFTSIGLLVIAARTRMLLAAVLLAAGTVFVAVLRTWLTFRDVRQLADTRVLARTDDLTGSPTAGISIRRSSAGSPTERGVRRC